MRIRFGTLGIVWRNSPRGYWPTKDIQETLHSGCLAAEVPPFTPHALHRAFATDAASALPRHTVAQAGGWHGLERLDDHYVQPRGTTIRAKLAGARLDFSQVEKTEDAVGEPTLVPQRS